MTSSLENPVQTRQKLRRSFQLCTAEGVVATPMVFLTIGGNFLMAALLIKVFSLDMAVYGVLASLPAWANTFQIFLIPALSRRFSSRSITLLNAWSQVLIWTLFTLVLPILPREEAGSAAPFLFLLLVMISLTQALTGVGWTSWLQEWTPRRLRGRYLGRRNRWCSLSMIVFLLLGGYLVEVFDGEIIGYQILFGAVTLLRLFGVLLMHGIHTPTDPQEESAPKLGWTRQMGTLWKDMSFRRFVLFMSLCAFCMNFAGPFYPVFMYDVLELGVGQVNHFIVLGSLAGAIAWPFWGRACDRFGCKAVIVVSVLIWETPNYLWSFLTPDTSFILYFMFAWGGLVGCGFFMGTFNLLLKIIPVSAKMSGVSLNLALSSLAAGIAPILAGLLFRWFDPAADSFALPYRVVFALKTTVLLLALLGLRSITEPHAAKISFLLGGMRTYRNLLAAQGLTVFANFHPFSRKLRTRKKGEKY